MQVTYRDLAEYGLPFVTPDDTRFPALVEDIRSRHSLGPMVPDAVEHGGVLLNESGKAVIALTYLWIYTDSRGQSFRHRSGNLGSSTQWDVLAGFAPVYRDRFSFLLSGSKRLITQGGIFGDNSDVVPPVPAGGGMGHGGSREQQATAVESAHLELDGVFFEDGLFAGADESNMFDDVVSALNQRVALSRQLAEAWQAGGSPGALFEILRSHARRQFEPSRRLSFHANSMFARMAVDNLIRLPDEELLPWLERLCEPPRLTLRRA